MESHPIRVALIFLSSVKEVANVKANKLMIFVRRNLPTILTITGALSGAASLYFTGVGTVKAVRKYDKLKEEGVEITPKVIVKHIVPYYIPAIGFAGTSLGCSITANTIHKKRNKALTLAAIGAMESLRDFKEKTIEVAGEEVEKKIEEKRAQETELTESPTSYLGKKIRVYDDFTRMKFETTWENLKDAEDDVNRTLHNPWMGMTRVELRKFYKDLGVDLSKSKAISAENHAWDEEYLAINWEMTYVDFYDKETFVDNDGVETILLRYFPEPEPQHEIDEYFATNGY